MFHLPKRYSDWDFDKKSPLWVAKGPLKESNTLFRSEQDSYRTAGERLKDLPRLGASVSRVAIVLPRLDLPFRKPRGPKDFWSLARGVRVDDRRLRRHWRDFAELLAVAIRSRGCAVHTVTLPLWRITAERLNALDADLVVVPHKQHFDLPALERPAWFYMQQALPWLFSLDRLGWNSSGSRYPCDFGAGDPARPTFDRCRQLTVDGNASKFRQPARLSRGELAARGEIPAQPYIFMPCQRPDDLSIRLFCDYDPVELVGTLAAWARARGIPLVLKAHPTNPKSAQPLKRAAEGAGIHWSDASIHDLIAHSAAVYVINSGVGLEAMLHDKPVVTFGRVEYDAVTLRGDLGDLDRTWQAASGGDPRQRCLDYRRFIDWYCRFACVDLSDPLAAEARLTAFVGQVLDRHPGGAAVLEAAGRGSLDFTEPRVAHGR